MPIKLILDCDPGIDDAVAMAMALASPELDVRGITVCHGNVSLDRTKANALSMLALLGSDVEVYAGASCPLMRSEISAGDVHGASGLGGIPMPAPRRGISGRRATEFIIDEVRAHPGEICLVGVGPLTNLALAMRLAPDIVPLIGQIVIMGGAVGAGNRTPSAEFNIYADPHAAKIVFDCGRPFTMFGLDVTHKAIASPARVAALRALGAPVGETVASLLEVYRAPYQARYGWDGAAVHDMCAIAYLIDPTLFTTQSMSVCIDIQEGPNFGRTVCDPRRRDPTWSLVNVSMDVDAERLFALLCQRIANYGRR